MDYQRIEKELSDHVAICRMEFGVYPDSIHLTPSQIRILSHELGNGPPNLDGLSDGDFVGTYMNIKVRMVK